MLFSHPKENAKSQPSRPKETGGLARMISSAGRIGLTALQRMVQAVSREDFIRFMQQPVLAGAAIHIERWRRPDQTPARK
jgi:hypothetical protein